MSKEMIVWKCNVCGTELKFNPTTDEFDIIITVIHHISIHINDLSNALNKYNRRVQ